MSFILALSPIILVLVGILGFKKKAKDVSLVALIYTIFLAFTYFNIKKLSFDQVVASIDPLIWKGIKEGGKIVLMLLGSFVMLEIMKKSGAMEIIKSAMAKITKDRRAQLIIIGMMLPIFLEGSAGATVFLFSNFIGPEVTSMGTGLVSIILSIIYLKVIKIKTPDEYISRINFENINKRFSTFRAFSPYLILIIALPVIRYTVDMKILTKFGYIVWVDCVIFICAILSAIILKVKYKEFIEILGQTLKKVSPVLVTMGSLMIVAYIMQSSNTNMMGLIAETLSHVGWLYPAIAVLIGAFGSFVTGTGLGSNIMFAPLHIQTAAVVSPIGVLEYKGKDYSINNKQIGEVTQKLYDELTGIQWGEREDRYNWCQKID